MIILEHFNKIVFDDSEALVKFNFPPKIKSFFKSPYYTPTTSKC